MEPYLSLIPPQLCPKWINMLRVILYEYQQE